MLRIVFFISYILLCLIQVILSLMCCIFCESGKVTTNDEHNQRQSIFSKKHVDKNDQFVDVAAYLQVFSDTGQVLPCKLTLFFILTEQHSLSALNLWWHHMILRSSDQSSRSRWPLTKRACPINKSRTFWPTDLAGIGAGILITISDSSSFCSSNSTLSFTIFNIIHVTIIIYGYETHNHTIVNYVAPYFNHCHITLELVKVLFYKWLNFANEHIATPYTHT